MKTKVREDRTTKVSFVLVKKENGLLVFLYDILNPTLRETVWGSYDEEKVWVESREEKLVYLKNKNDYLKDYQIFKVTKEVISTVKVEKI